MGNVASWSIRGEGLLATVIVQHLAQTIPARFVAKSGPETVSAGSSSTTCAISTGRPRRRHFLPVRDPGWASRCRWLGSNWPRSRAERTGRSAWPASIYPSRRPTRGPATGMFGQTLRAAMKVLGFKARPAKRQSAELLKLLLGGVPSPAASRHPLPRDTFALDSRRALPRPPKRSVAGWARARWPVAWAGCWSASPGSRNSRDRLGGRRRYPRYALSSAPPRAPPPSKAKNSRFRPGCGIGKSWSRRSLQHLFQVS